MTNGFEQNSVAPEDIMAFLPARMLEAWEALNVYRKQNPDDPDELATTVSDLVADLMHWLKAYDFPDPEDTVAIGVGYFDAEQRDLMKDWTPEGDE